ncbi:unnamed protein product [Hydatigera taeniaeformis]|uniref:Auxilin-like protein 1 n=1 Tax=Hydatigena taeniaeformis TaxID=6205 RepID=A0A0R3X3G4_HYDTA|nr:unnamed protein product [Hydatigera taeniaeformis]
MEDYSNFGCAFGGSRFEAYSSQQHPVHDCFGTKSTGNTAPTDLHMKLVPENSCSRKRHFDQPDFFEGVYVPQKRPASEEAISRGLSNLNISQHSGIKYNEVEMVSVEETSDESDDECDEEKGFSPKACLALVPYVPRPTLPPIPASDSPISSNFDDKDMTETKVEENEPMECLSVNQAPELRLTPAFESSISLGQVGSASSQPTFVYEQPESSKLVGASYTLMDHRDG